ncbi:amidohydrolase family protein [Phytohabitans sp. ZYX-F-186]|uniref:Amidohydrolase family protein n=1 Tax=Phytohabitans maris TaxID=3071409 RepID=A0ABU0ZPD3_9ACTN|nr:amidohydrolase family protein [Phytohabitans sp. ZYX-F-186]MDQ7908895.1 amidohydrolase family protein [Phytohabitans sp. ZYX-F-186]
MIIDCHGHYTTAPAALDRFRAARLAAGGERVSPPSISDDEIRESVEGKQLAHMDERGIDLTLFSPKASAMGHHVPGPAAAAEWARVSNDLVHRVVALFPRRFAAVCQLPQTPDGSLDEPVRELRRCVAELGFVGCNLNPDPSGGFWSGRPLTDPAWYPLYEALVELDVPAMVHVSASCNPNAHTLGAHYLNADTAAFVQLMGSDLFTRFPGLRLVVPHGGGAVPYHWGRFRGLAERYGWPDPSALLSNVWFDTCVYHEPGVRLLLDVIGADNVLFASEMLGAVRGVDPNTGGAWDDTRRYVERLDLTPEDRQKVYAGNARRVYPQLPY